MPATANWGHTICVLIICGELAKPFQDRASHRMDMHCPHASKTQRQGAHCNTLKLILRLRWCCVMNWLGKTILQYTYALVISREKKEEVSIYLSCLHEVYRWRILTKQERDNVWLNLLDPYRIFQEQHRERQGSTKSECLCFVWNQFFPSPRISGVEMTSILRKKQPSVVRER